MPTTNQIRDRPAPPTYCRNKGGRAAEILAMPERPRQPAFVRERPPEPDKRIVELSPEEVGAYRKPSGLTVKCCKSKRYRFRCAALDESDGYECWRYDTKPLVRRNQKEGNDPQEFPMRCSECMREEGRMTP